MQIKQLTRLLAVVVVLSLTAGCAARRGEGYATDRDKTKRGAWIGGATGAVLGAVIGEGEADEILAAAIIGAGIGAGVGAYMDKQEEKLAQIPGTSVERIGEDMLLVHFDSDVLFASDSAALGADSESVLDEAASVFLEYPKTAIVAQGHTDATGSDAHNQDLSERRANSVKSYLIDGGVEGARIIALGFGETEPIADNSTVEGRRNNRRVDILLKAKTH